MKVELKILFEFQSVIIDMQRKVIEARAKGAKENVLQESISRIDKLIEVYKNYDRYYYGAHYAGQKILHLESQMMELSDTIETLKTENSKLAESINWSEQK